MKKEKQEKEKKQDKGQEKEEQIKELTETLQRVQANFENYRKQVEKKTGQAEKTAARKIICELLPILDTFELALKNKKAKEFAEGMEMIYSQIFSLLEKQGLKAIKSLGEKFDPYKHEALLKIESREPEDIVIDEMQKGYTLNGEVVRYSKVKLSKGNQNEKKSKEGENDKEKHSC